MGKYFFLACLFSLEVLSAHMIHQNTIEPIWQKESLAPFNELIFSWNADRPKEGKYHFFVSAKTKNWSPWLLYATWGEGGQKSFSNTAENAPIRVYQDALEILDENLATGFQIKIVTEGNASLDQIHHLHVYTNSEEPEEGTSSFDEFIHLPVPGLSQMVLSHPRHKDLCSPTSTTAVTRYLSQKDALDPIEFALESWDGGFDIFGNWIFNVATSATKLGKNWSAWVERLSGFSGIYERLKQGTPVVVSVRSPLPGSAMTYSKGHLIAVIGYDPSEKKVICMDPAFPSNEETFVRYDLSDFIQAWSRRGKIAYVFGNF